MSGAGGPLSEVSPMGVRRNSPSITQSQFQPKGASGNDSSPFDPSPANAASPRNFWKGRESPSSPSRIPVKNIESVANFSGKRRSSLEKLQKASRVKNSNMFARETQNNYDPDQSSTVERPLASGRPLSQSFQGNAFTGAGSPLASPSKSPGHRRSESSTKIPLLSPSKAKTQGSPQKSSLSTRHDIGEEQIVIHEDGRGTPRPNKTVSFDNGPPQINEYEMITPDPSSVASGSREGSYDLEQFDDDDEYYDDNGDEYRHEDSFDESLEDTAKTPVVLPEDWRFMSPQNANTGLANTFEDPFEEGRTPVSPLGQRQTQGQRSESVNSDGEPRPLPPLPAKSVTSPNDSTYSPRPGSSGSSKTENRTPRPASISKEDILSMRTNKMPLDERLRMLALQNDESSEHTARAQSPVGLGIGSPGPSVDAKDADDAPRISRESIMQKVKNRQEERDVDCSSAGSSPARCSYADFHPDEPVPSRETSSNYGPEVMQSDTMERSGSEDADDVGLESSVIRYDIPDGTGFDFGFGHDANEDDSIVDVSPDYPLPSIEVPADAVGEHNDMSLPDFKHSEDLSFSLAEYMSPSPPPVIAEKPIDTREVVTPPQVAQSSAGSTSPASDATAVQEEETSEPSRELSDQRNEPLRPATPVLEPPQEQEEPETPESVIHHPVEDYYEFEHEEDDAMEPAEEIHDSIATVKAPGGKLKTRASASCADLEDLRDEAFGTSSDESRPGSGSSHSQNEASQAKAELNRRLSDRMKLELNLSEDLGAGLGQEFDRLIEAQKRGYLMRQNTKVVVASNRQASGSSNGEEAKPNLTRKPSGKTWTTEPWNGKMRRQSSRRSNYGASKGAVPPLPGQESNAQALDSVTEEGLSALEPDSEVERGRLFVKVVGVKDLDLPLPKSERNWFQLTLDNGLHCVTTAWLELGRNAPIGQEFELTVFQELDFSLTLQTKLERPRSAGSSIDSLSARPSKKGSTLSRFLQSPKKRKEIEKKQQEQEALAALQRQQELVSRQPTSWDLLNGLVGADGSFARAIVSLDDHEKQAFGRPYTVDIPCFNSWAAEESDNTTSTRSKHGGVPRRPPYKICNLELQLLYIPKPKGIKDEDMPQSMSSAIRKLREAEADAAREHEGFLSQQGGDCPFWRRRFFRLNGSNLTSYHESTRQRRANINLAKAVKLIDDRSALTQPDGMAKGGKGRRRSAFAEEEEGYMFVEEGFRIRFANGEIIDFYAENTATKDGWMRVLAEVIGKDLTPNKVSWTSAVLASRRLHGQDAKTGKPQANAHGSRSVPTSPMKNARPQSMILDKPIPPIPNEKSPLRKKVPSSKPQITPGHETPPPTLTERQWDGTSPDMKERRKNVRSMIF